MSVFPAGSSTLVPPTWADLMTNPVSITLKLFIHLCYLELLNKKINFVFLAVFLLILSFILKKVDFDVMVMFLEDL